MSKKKHVNVMGQNLDDREDSSSAICNNKRWLAFPYIDNIIIIIQTGCITIIYASRHRNL